MNGTRLGSHLILLLGALLVAGSLAAHADTVTLKNGTVFDGTIVSEDDQQVVIEMEFAGGTILKKETVKKMDVASVAKLTAEQKAARVMQQAYRAASKYQLDANSSFAETYYDQVITGIFRTFLAKYPDSTDRPAVEALIARWQEERDKVAAGQVKVRGQWLTGSAAAKVRAQQMLAQANQSLATGKFSEAMEKTRAAAKLSGDKEVADAAIQLETKIVQQWTPALQRARQQISAQLLQAETRLAEVRRAAAQADQQAQAAQDKADSSRTNLGLPSRIVTKELGEKLTTRAQSHSELTVADGVTTQLRKQLATIDATLTQIGAPLVPPTTQTVAVATAPAPKVAMPNGTGDSFLDSMVAWFLDHWMLMAGAVLLFVLLLWRWTKG